MADPSELLKRSLEAFQSNAVNMDASIGSDWNGVWYALNNPELITEENYTELLDWKKHQEKWYRDMHDEGRPYIQDALLRMPKSERDQLISRPSKVLEYFVKQGGSLEDLVKGMVAKCGQTDISTQQVLRLEEWRFFLGGMVYGFYMRSVQPNRFSKKVNPGSIDTQQSIYLAGSDLFVSCDKRQRQMMRWLVPLGFRSRRIWHYREFKNWILQKDDRR